MPNISSVCKFGYDLSFINNNVDYVKGTLQAEMP